MTGGTPSRDKAEYFGGRVRWLVSGDIHQREIFECEGRITEAGMKNSNAKFLPINSVMIALNGQGKTRGSVSLLRVAATCNQSLVSIYPKDPDQLIPEYLYANLHGRYQEIRQMTGDSGNDRRGLNMALINRIEIPIPPLPEQKRIVAILDEAFEGIGAAVANAEKNLANARELFASEFQLVINKRGQNWEEISLGELAETSLGKMLDKQKNKGELKPYLRNLNVRWFEFDLNDLQEMRFEGDETERYSIRKGDVVICEGGYPGRAAVWESDETVFFQKALHRVRFKHPSLSKWLTYLLYLADMRGELKHHFTGTGIQHFTGESLKRFKVLAPPLTQLPDITNKIDKLFHQCKFLEAIYQEKITAFAKLKQSLLARAFSGELATVGPAMEQPNVPVESFATPERVADIIAFAQQRHKPSDREATYGRVKAQKTLHLIESMGGIDLGRQPMKDAAGPNDFQHMLNAEEWAKQHQFFKFVKRPAGGYDFKKLSRYGQMMSRASETLKPVESTLKRIVDILVPMDTDGAELLATVHAAWNNLILNGAEITEDAIVREAREDWHPDKLKIPEYKFRDMIKFIRNNGFIPDGSAKRVGGQASLF
jgi:restriction endonuclease S subunit